MAKSKIYGRTITKKKKKKKSKKRRRRKMND